MAFRVDGFGLLGCRVCDFWSLGCSASGVQSSGFKVLGAEVFRASGYIGMECENRLGF